MIFDRSRTRNPPRGQADHHPQTDGASEEPRCCTTPTGVASWRESDLAAVNCCVSVAEVANVVSMDIATGVQSVWLLEFEK